MEWIAEAGNVALYRNGERVGWIRPLDGGSCRWFHFREGLLGYDAGVALSEADAKVYVERQTLWAEEE